MIGPTDEMIAAAITAAAVEGVSLWRVEATAIAAAVLAVVERDQAAAAEEAGWEYTQMRCDIWQMHHLASDWRGRYGWEAVAVVNLPAGYKVPRDIGDEDGPEQEAVCPVAVLFRRPVRSEP